jgi:hypothetical protein
MSPDGGQVQRDVSSLEGIQIAGVDVAKLLDAMNVSIGVQHLHAE